MTLREHIEAYIIKQNPVCTPMAAQDLFTLAIGADIATGKGAYQPDWDVEYKVQLGKTDEINHYYVRYFVKVVETVLGDFAHSPVVFVTHDDLQERYSPGISQSGNLSLIRLYVTPGDLGYQCVSPDSGKVSILYLQQAIDAVRLLCRSKDGEVTVIPLKSTGAYFQMKDTRQVVYSVTIVLEPHLLSDFFFALDTSMVFEHFPSLLFQLGVLHQFEPYLTTFERCEL